MGVVVGVANVFALIRNFVQDTFPYKAKYLIFIFLRRPSKSGRGALRNKYLTYCGLNGFSHKFPRFGEHQSLIIDTTLCSIYALIISDFERE